MKSLALAAAGVAFLAIPHSGAPGASFVVGSALASDCYEAALARNDGNIGLQACNQALEETALNDRDRAATLVNRGILQLIRGRYPEARSDFDAAIALDPHSSDALLNKGILLLRQDKGSEALPLIERAIALDARREALAYYARGIAHEQTGNIRAAYADLVRARDLEPAWDVPAKELTRYQVRR